LRKYSHPITCERLTYSNKPILVSNGDLFNGQTIKQIAAGEFHNCMLTHKGCVYSWGLATHGQLGVPKRKGMINKLLDRGGNKIAFKPFHLEYFQVKNVERITARRNMSLAFSSEGEVYTWGTFPKGLALQPA
jgi:alpha-tubulin suppressor-like RCC1 family protein